MGKAVLPEEEEEEIEVNKSTGSLTKNQYF